jgi:hypothetical protein
MIDNAPALGGYRCTEGALRGRHLHPGPSPATSEEPDPSVSPADPAGFRMVGGWVVPRPRATGRAILAVLVAIPKAGVAGLASRVRPRVSSPA